jgi:hypothetical protein
MRNCACAGVCCAVPEYRLVAKKGEGTFSEVLKAQVPGLGGVRAPGAPPPFVRCCVGVCEDCHCTPLLCCVGGGADPAGGALKARTRPRTRS